MAFSENLTSFENWTFRPSLADSWISESFARDTETLLTKALQKSLSSNESETLTDNNNNNNNNNNNSSLFGSFNIIKPHPTPTGSGSDQDASSKRCRNPKSNGGKITKRKSRASKRSPTTFITADPSNFRQMVQQVTGIRFGNPQLPVMPVLKPEPQRPGNRIQNINCSSLPPTTIDSSTFLLNNTTNNQHPHQHLAGSTSGATISYGHVAEDGSSSGVAGGLDFGSFQSFPTLESWRVM